MRRIRDAGITIGTHPTGPRNSIADVDGVTVGHVTLDDGRAKTGVTAILPAPGNVFRSKLLCGAVVFNGYGKYVGLVQIEELGTLESPIVLTNTLAIGDAVRGLVEERLAADPGIGREAGTFNPVVLECNDGVLNDLRALPVRPEHVRDAIARAAPDFEQGAVGAGTGMSAYQLKGGIGSASRTAVVFGRTYTLGGLVLTNMGRLQDLIVDGRPIGRRLAAARDAAPPQPDKGSIVLVVATDAPLSSRQLKRLARRCLVGISRTGSHLGHGSGEVALAFSTAHRVPHDADALLSFDFLPDGQLDLLFEPLVELVEEAILDSMFLAADTVGRDGNRRDSLAGLLFGPEGFDGSDGRDGAPC